MKRLNLGCIFLLILALLLLTGGGAKETIAGKINPSIGSGFRCGNLMMEEGLEKLKVIVNCGEPIATDKSWIDRYGEVEKLYYGPISGYYYVLYFFHGNLISVEEVRQL